MPKDTHQYRRQIHTKAETVLMSLAGALKDLDTAHLSKEDIRRLKTELAGALKKINATLSELQSLDIHIGSRIEELKQEIEQLKKEKASVGEAVIAETREGMIVADQAGVIAFSNKSAGSLLGEPEDLVGKNLEKIFKFEDEHGNTVPRRERPIEKAFAGKKISVSVRDNVYVVRSDKTRFPVMMSVLPTMKKGVCTSVVILFHEVKKRSDRMRTDFISMASHQLRTPLTVSNLQVDMLLAGHGGELNEEQREYVEEIKFYNQKMSQVLNEFLTVSRIERGSFVIEPKPTDVVAIAADVVRELSHQALSKDIDIIERYDKRMPILVTDPEFLRIVFHNLISNAVKYTPPGGKVTVAISKKEGGVTIKVSDTGYGIPPSDKEKIFSKLFRGKEAEKREPNGMGLGLYIVKSFLERCGGTIRFTSKEKKGTTFSVSLPLRIGKTYRKVPA